MKILKSIAVCALIALAYATMEVSVWAGELPIELPYELVDTTAALCEQYGVDYDIVVAIAWHESRFDVDAVNDQTGCIGLMQIAPVHWDYLLDDHGIDVHTPEGNIEAGIFLLAGYLDDYALEESLAAFAEGEAGMLQGCGIWFAKEILDIVSGME